MNHGWKCVNSFFIRNHLNLIVIIIFKVTFIPEKGRGVLAKRKYNAGDYVCEYDGELITYNEGRQRESEYDQSMGCYLYFFEYNSKGWW